MRPSTAILAYVVMAFVTLGFMNVPHALYYEHPQLAFNRWYRDDLQFPFRA